ncbi:hypothetical protein QP884_06995 [Corynebacterium tuberculostearicum]|nr:hypothetical protein [Corynebacterium tuberculostearicum]MDK8677422.1 hypothetical protein [Corynebacterium tuberculostearicum]
MSEVARRLSVGKATLYNHL